MAHRWQGNPLLVEYKVKDNAGNRPSIGPGWTVMAFARNLPHCPDKAICTHLKLLLKPFRYFHKPLFTIIQKLLATQPISPKLF